MSPWAWFFIAISPVIALKVGGLAMDVRDEMRLRKRRPCQIDGLWWVPASDFETTDPVLAHHVAAEFDRIDPLRT